MHKTTDHFASGIIYNLLKLNYERFSSENFRKHVHSRLELFVDHHLVLLFDRLPIWRKLEKFFSFIYIFKTTYTCKLSKMFEHL